MTRPVPAQVVQQVARLSFQAEGGGSSPTPALHFVSGTVAEANALLAPHHYLGSIRSGRSVLLGFRFDVLVATQVYKWPTARMLPTDGTWLELARWCLVSEAGKNAGSRMMGYAAKWLRSQFPDVHTLVSYSDPVHGHDGALYKASGWTAAPTHHSLRFMANGKGYPSGHGSWDGLTVQAPKMRWTYPLRTTP